MRRVWVCKITNEREGNVNKIAGPAVATCHWIYNPHLISVRLQDFILIVWGHTLCWNVCSNVHRAHPLTVLVREAGGW